MRCGAWGVWALILARQLHVVAAARSRPVAGQPVWPAPRALAILGVAPSPFLPFQRAPVARCGCRSLAWHKEGEPGQLGLPGLPAGLS